MQHFDQVAERIRAVRRERGWTQDELASRMGVSRSAIAEWETGRSGQLSTNLPKIAVVLDVGVEYLLFGNDKLAPGKASSADEWALLRLYRESSQTDRQRLLRIARTSKANGEVVPKR